MPPLLLHKDAFGTRFISNLLSYTAPFFILFPPSPWSLPFQPNNDTDSAILLLDHTPCQSTETIRISKQSVQLMQLLQAVTAARKQGRDQGDRVPALLRAVAQLVATGRPLGDAAPYTSSHQQPTDSKPFADMPLAGPMDVGVFGEPPALTVSAADLSKTAATAEVLDMRSPAPAPEPSAPSFLDALLADSATGGEQGGLQAAFPEAAAVFERAGLNRVAWQRDEGSGEEFVERQVC